MTPKEATRNWQPDGSEPAVQIYVSEVAGELAELVNGRVAGFPIGLNLVSGSDWIDVNDLTGLPAAVIEVDATNPVSIKRFQQLAAAAATPLFATADNPPLALVRTLVRAGAHDVIPLPLTRDDLEVTLAPLRDESTRLGKSHGVASGKVVTAIKSVGGVGATAMLTQLALRWAEMQQRVGREVCLIDFDVQFGDVAFQLGTQNKLTVIDLIEAGGRLDSDLLRSTTARHRTGLNFIGAPRDMLPIEGVAGDPILQIVELSRKNFATTFIDLPTNWTNWSLSLVARSEVVLLFTELSVSGLNGARRQLDLLESQDLGGLDIRIIVNRYEKSQSRLFREQDIRKALGRDVSFYISNDFALMRAAVDRGVTLAEIKRRSELGDDIDALAESLAPALEIES